MSYYIGITGPNGAGKSEFAKYLAESAAGTGISCGIVESSAVLKRIADTMRTPQEHRNRPTFQGLVEVMDDENEGWLSGAVKKRLTKLDAQVRIFAGMRLPSDLRMMRLLIPSLIIAVVASENVRYERLRIRGQRPGETGLTWEQFLVEENAYTERFIEELVSQADITIVNIGSKEDLKEAAYGLRDTFFSHLGTTTALVT